jgi:diaminohydroxyphosphoribosylaminopyrimidine deaminase/5-amino-6-(5-phosphoribosylamino)uracil reductase
MMDPDERVSGQGKHQLIDSGVQVTGPVLRSQCERLNRGYISLRTKNRPYITLKRAQTFEGNVANADGSTLSITSQNQNKWSHANLRATHDAILVGVQTVIADDPQLTNRISTYQPIKIILDPDLRIPRDAKLIDNRTIIITQKDAEPIGDAKVITVPIIDNHFDWDVLWNQFSTFHFPLSTILVEGGPKTWDAFWKASLVDEEVILIGS